MNRRLIIFYCLLGLSFPLWAIDADFQIFYDFGSENTACPNQRSNRVTTTFEFFHPDNWGNTFFFIDMDFSINKKDPKNCPFGTYMEFSRAFNFWQQTKGKDLSVLMEYDGGFGIYQKEIETAGYPVNNSLLVGLDYFLYTPDYKNRFNLQLFFQYIADELNMWHYRDNGEWITQSGNQVPLHFTFVWACDDFCKAKGLTFKGFAEIWGQKLAYKSPNQQSFIFFAEPQLWYAFGQWFKCPNLCVGTEIEFTYNYTGNGFMCNPCLGLKWLFL